MEKLAAREVQVRPVKAEDMSAVFELEGVSFKDPFPSYFLRQLADANPETFLVAVDDGNVVGYTVVDSWYDHQHLVSIAVRPESRRRGIGQFLMDGLVERLAKGVLRLEVRRSNKEALGFYVKNGFKETGVSHSYYADGEDAIQMERLVEKKVESIAPA